MVPFQGTVSPFYPTDCVEKVLQEWWQFLKPTEIVNSMDWILCSALAAHGHTVLCVNFCLPRGVNGSSVAVERIHHSADSLWHPLSPQNKSPVVHIVAVKMTFGITSDLMSQRQKAKRKSFRKINRISITATGQERNNLRNPENCSGILLGPADLKKQKFYKWNYVCSKWKHLIRWNPDIIQIIGIMSWPVLSGIFFTRNKCMNVITERNICFVKHAF